MPSNAVFLMAVCAGSPAAHAQLSSDQLAGVFHDFCLASLPSLVALEAKAGALHGTKQMDKIVPLGANRSLHEETWLIRRENSIYQLTAMEGDAASGPNRAVGCGLTASQADGRELAQTLATEGGLGAPVTRVPASGAQGNSVVWNKMFGQAQGKVALNYGDAAPGASIHLIIPNLPR